MARDFMVATDSIERHFTSGRLTADRPGPWGIFERILRAARRLARARVEPIELQPTRIRTFSVAKGAGLMDRLRLQQRDLDMIYDQRAKYLFVGPEIMDGFAREWRAMSVGPIPFELNGHRGVRIFGIEVIVIPWMEGVLLVPDWERT